MMPRLANCLWTRDTCQGAAAAGGLAALPLALPPGVLLPAALLRPVVASCCRNSRLPSASPASTVCPQTANEVMLRARQEGHG
jgi:hypothetical protein